MTQRLWRERILEPSRVASAVKFCANTGEQQSHGSARERIDTALADAACCSGRQFNYVRNSLADFEKLAAARDAFLHAAVLGNSRRLNRSRNRAKFLAGIAPMDAAHVADFYCGNSVHWCLGHCHIGSAVASIAVLSLTRGSFTKFG